MPLRRFILCPSVRPISRRKLNRCYCFMHNPSNLVFFRVFSLFLLCLGFLLHPCDLKRSLDNLISFINCVIIWSPKLQNNGLNGAIFVTITKGLIVTVVSNKNRTPISSKSSRRHSYNEWCLFLNGKLELNKINEWCLFLNEKLELNKIRSSRVAAAEFMRERGGVPGRLGGHNLDS